MRISVTKTDIKRGRTGDPWCCPVALAIRRATKAKDPHAVAVCLNAEVTIGEEYFCAELPRNAKDFIGRFDFGDPVKPFSFDLELPKE